MNAFVEHHKHSIQFGYRCFDRLLLNGLIQPFQQPERVHGFFNTYREGKRVTRCGEIPGGYRRRERLIALCPRNDQPPGASVI
jgi:hypothetical protein